MNRRWHVKKARAPPGQVVSARPDLRRIHVNHECQPSVNRRLFEACQPVSISNRTRYNDWLSWQLPSASDPPNCHSARGCRCPLYSRGSDWNIIRSPHNETARPPPFIPVRCCCSSPRVRGSTRTTPSNYIENLAYGLVTRTLSSLARDRALCLPVDFMDFSGNGIHGNVGGPTAPFRDDMLDFDRLPCSDFETWKPGEIFFPKKFSTNHRVVILRSSLLRDYIFEERLEEKRGICISVEIPEELPSSLTAGREIHA